MNKIILLPVTHKPQSLEANHTVFIDDFVFTLIKIITNDVFVTNYNNEIVLCGD